METNVIKKMAFSPGHYRAGSGGQGHGANAVDGVLVRISDRFLPLDKIALPLDYKMGNPSEVLFMEYDFSLETKVIEWTENERKTREEIELAKQERIRLAVEEQKEAETENAVSAEEIKNNDEERSLPNESIPEGSGQEMAAHPPAETMSPTGPFMNVTSDILTPTVLASGSNESSHSQIMPHPSLTNSTSFNLADFENEQDPFDNLELKTLDDMAELNKVLQGAHTAEPATNQDEDKNVSAFEQRTTTTSVEKKEQNRTNVLTTSRGPENTSQISNQVDKSSVQEPAPSNIKDVEYPDFDTLETPDNSLSDPSNSIASQQMCDNTPVTYSSDSTAVDSHGQVSIQTGSYASVSFSNRKAPQTQAGHDPQKSGNLYSYKPVSPVANSYTNQQQSSPPGAVSQNTVSNSHGYNYSTNSNKPSTSCSPQQSVISGPAQYMQHGNNPWSSSGVSSNHWSALASGKLSTNPWEPPKNYSTNPWDVPSTSSNITNPWRNITATTHDTNPWGPPSVYANSSSNEKRTLRSARSNPDLTKLCDRPVRILPTSHTPPPTTGISRTKTPPPQPTSNQSWNPYHVLPPTSSPVNLSQNSESVTSRKAESLPDPYNSMSLEMKRFINGIADMGFSRARVARTAQKLGQDDKKVVDHLCMVNRLSEQGMVADEAELALHLFHQQEDKAKEYIKLLGQFKELGFSDDKIQEALINSNLDENKTLDVLTSS